MPFLLRLDDTGLLPELADMLRRAECDARVAGDAVVADVPRAPSRRQAERELRIYLALWDAQHPGSKARLAAADDA